MSAAPVSRFLATLAGQDWMGRAACTLDQAEEWWPVTRGGQEAAAAYCRAQCPVLEQCREWADQAGEIQGVWGGETEQQRRDRLAGRPGRRDRLHRCEHCQKVYTAKRPEQRYCGHNCHNLAMAKVSIGGIPNPNCGTPGGARRHRKHGEPVDALCRYAESLYRAQMRAEQRDGHRTKDAESSQPPARLTIQEGALA